MRGARVRDACRAVAAVSLLTVISVSAGDTRDRAAAASECVVLLHGLARSSASMSKLAGALDRAGYVVANVDYPSTTAPIESLAPQAVEAGVASCRARGAAVIHFVTHSLGGILVRQYLAEHEIAGLGRVVMLAPPNQGSEVVDVLGNTLAYRRINGPAGLQLGTGVDSVPRRLGSANFELGVIAGNKSINLVLSQFLPHPDDGKVSVESAKLEGMRDFLVVPRTHTFIMRGDDVIRQVVHFLQFGRFDSSAAQAHN